MLNLICGPSGAGKSRRILRAIGEDISAKRRCYLLVPEQQAYISERDVSAMLPSNAGLYFEIVNFSKLADAIFRRYGGCAAPSAGSGIRSVLVWNTLRQLAPSLEQYGKSKIDASLTAEMFTTLQELQNNGIDSDQLREIADRLDESTPLKKKLRDLEMIYAQYIVHTEAAFNSLLPPGEAVVLHKLPIINRVAPKLTVGTVAVGRTACNDGGITVLVKQELFGCTPYVHRVVRNVYWHITDNHYAEGMRILDERLPLCVKLELNPLPEAAFCGKFASVLACFFYILVLVAPRGPFRVIVIHLECHK